MTAGGMFWFSRLSEHAAYPSQLLGPMLVTSSGLGLLFVPLALVALHNVADQHATGRSILRQRRAPRPVRQRRENRRPGRSRRGRSGCSSGASLPDPPWPAHPLRRSDGHRARSSGVTKWKRLHNDCGQSAAMSLAVVPSLYPHRSTALEENDMTATYTFDVFSSLDGYGSHSGNWGGYWGKQGPELLDHRLALYGAEQRMVFGANTYRAFARMLASSTEESEVRDPWVTRMRSLPATVVSTTLEGPLDWPNATVVSGDAVDVVARLKEESEVPLRSHGSLSLNRALMAAGLVDLVQVTLFPVITGQTGLDPIFQGAADFDLELVENRTLDGHIQELIYRPTLH